MDTLHMTKLHYKYANIHYEHSTSFHFTRKQYIILYHTSLDCNIPHKTKLQHSTQGGVLEAAHTALCPEAGTGREVCHELNFFDPKGFNNVDYVKNYTAMNLVLQ